VTRNAPTGAHVSVAGGLDRALERGRAIGATALQIFTKQPQRWAEPELTDEEVEAFRSAREASDVQVVSSHDSYLINLATEKPDLLEKSEAAFRGELARCRRLGVDVLVTHPGNATGGDREAALRQNARVVARSLEEEPGPTRVLLETTAGSGTALGWRFEELAALLEEMPPAARDRVGICVDTAHVFAAGYDLREDYEAVMGELDAAVGIDRVGLLHLNDSRAELGSRVDRHAHIGEGELGDAGFRGLLRDPRLASVPRVLETPKDDDATASDRRNLEALKRLSGG
jgi:deoxyribonuclease-4